jgi:hypothetical protein
VPTARRVTLTTHALITDDDHLPQRQHICRRQDIAQSTTRPSPLRSTAGKPKANSKHHTSLTETHPQTPVARHRPLPKDTMGEALTLRDDCT